MRRVPEFFIPRTRRWSGWGLAISAGLHLLLLTIRTAPWLPPSRLPPSIVLIVPPGSEGQRAVEMKFQEPGGAAKRGKAAGITPRPEQEPTPTPEVTPVEPLTLTAPPVAAQVEPGDSGVPVSPVLPRGGYIGPQRGEGKLWIRPLPAPPRELAQELTRSHFDLVDSAVSAIVSQYIDSVLSAPAEPGSKPPSWTTQIFGKTFGIDSKYIYLGPLKIPSAVLALLPIKGGTTMEYSQAMRLNLIREDLQRASQRAATLEDFKRAVRELRAQRERLHELETNQKLKPDPAKKDTTKTP